MLSLSRNNVAQCNVTSALILGQPYQYRYDYNDYYNDMISTRGRMFTVVLDTGN